MKERENDEKQINQILLSLASLERVSNASSSFVPVPACEIGTWRTCPALPRSSVDCYLFKTTQKTLGKRGGERRIVRFIILSYRTQPVVYCVQQIIIIIIIIPAWLQVKTLYTHNNENNSKKRKRFLAGQGKFTQEKNYIVNRLDHQRVHEHDKIVTYCEKKATVKFRRRRSTTISKWSWKNASKRKSERAWKLLAADRAEGSCRQSGRSLAFL